ncbi:MAG TPA: ATPase P [Chloroflexota bacterium]|nr:ATPase P [Chloroflexota bacterium]
MLSVQIPGRGDYAFERLVLNVNGTVAEDGHLIPGVKERLTRLARQVEIILVTAESFNQQVAIDRLLEMEAKRLDPKQAEAPQKEALIRSLGSDSAVAIGNGANDALMLKEAAIGIAVLESEGTALITVQNADVLARSIVEALDLLLIPSRLTSTLRQ